MLKRAAVQVGGLHLPAPLAFLISLFPIYTALLTERCSLLDCARRLLLRESAGEKREGKGRDCSIPRGVSPPFAFPFFSFQSLPLPLPLSFHLLSTDKLSQCTTFKLQRRFPLLSSRLAV